MRACIRGCSRKTEASDGVCGMCRCIDVHPVSIPTDTPAEPTIRPNHYRIPIRTVNGELECFDLCQALGFDDNANLFNVQKYLFRAGRKTPDALEDLKKAAVYLKREIERRTK